MQKKLLVTLISSTLSSFAWALTPVPPPELPDKNDNVLDDVIVSATRSEINTAEAPGSVTVVSRKEIEKKGGQNIVDLIRGTTGVNLRGIGTGGRKAISLRGMESKHTLVLIDGKRIPSSNDSLGPNTDYQYDWVASDNIERIEIVRGPMSVLYGADALGGVINIITRKTDKKTHASLKLKGINASGDAGGNGHSAEFNLSGSLASNIQARINTQESRRGSLESKLKTGQSALEGKKKQQVSLGLDWQPADNHNIKFDVTQGQEDRWYDTASVSRRTGVTTLYQSQYDIDREQVSLGWKGSIGKFDTALRAYQTKIDVSNKATNGIKATSPQNLKDTILDGNIRFPVGQKQFITTGFEHRTEKLEHINLKNGKDEVSLKSFYLQDEIDLNDDLLLTLGARLDDHEVFGDELSPRASIVWNATEKLTLKGSYGHGFKAPTIKQSSSDYIFSLGVIKVTGNPDLKPETSNALELGSNYSTGRFSIDTAIFDNKVKNLIELTGPITDRTYNNISEARLKGAEISTKYDLRKGLALNTSYQYLDAKDGDGNRLKHRPRHTLASGITWDKNSWQFSLNAEYLSGQIIEHNNISTDVPGYALWNAGARKHINKHLDLALRIDNLTNVRLEDKSDAFLHEEYPRTLSLELRGKF